MSRIYNLLYILLTRSWIFCCSLEEVGTWVQEMVKLPYFFLGSFFGQDRKILTLSAKCLTTKAVWLSLGFWKCSHLVHLSYSFCTQDWSDPVWRKKFNFVSIVTIRWQKKYTGKFVIWDRRVEMVFCYQNFSDLLWEKIVLVIEKNFSLQLRISNFFEITWTIYSNSERKNY